MSFIHRRAKMTVDALLSFPPTRSPVGVEDIAEPPHSLECVIESLDLTQGQGSTPQGAGATDLEAGLLGARFQDGKLVEVYQRSVLERRAEIVIESRPVTGWDANYGSVLPRRTVMEPN